MRLAGNAGPKKSPKNSPPKHHRTTLSGYIFTTKARIDNRKKNLLNSNVAPTCSHNMVNFCPLAADICWRVWGTAANFNRFRVLEALLHSTLVGNVSQTSRRSTEGATYIRQGGHHVAHWPTFLVVSMSRSCTVFGILPFLLPNATACDFEKTFSKTYAFCKYILVNLMQSIVLVRGALTIRNMI